MSFQKQLMRASKTEKRIGVPMGIQETWTKLENIKYYQDIFPYLGDMKFGQFAYQPDFVKYPRRHKKGGKVRFQFDEDDFAQAAYAHGVEFYGYPRDTKQQCTKEMFDNGECLLKYIPIDIDTGEDVDPSIGVQVTQALNALVLQDYGKTPIISLGRKGRFHLYIPLTDEETVVVSEDGVCRDEICKYAEKLNEMFDIEITCKTGGKVYGKEQRKIMVTIDPTSCDRDHYISLPYSLMIQDGKMYSRIPVTPNELFTKDVEELWEMSRDFVIDDDFRDYRLKEIGRLKL